VRRRRTTGVHPQNGFRREMAATGITSVAATILAVLLMSRVSRSGRP
jgi:hypothetical protein